MYPAKFSEIWANYNNNFGRFLPTLKNLLRKKKEMGSKQDFVNTAYKK